MTCEQCKMIEAREGQVVYSDPITHIILPENPAAKGHARIYSKKHVETLYELSDEEVEHLFEAASRTATVLFETLGAEGSNVIVNEGSISKGHLSLDVVARAQEDGIDTQWEPKQIPDGKMEEISGNIGDKVDTLGLEKPAKEKKSQSKKSTEKDSDVTKEMLKHVKRLP